MQKKTSRARNMMKMKKANKRKERENRCKANKGRNRNTEWARTSNSSSRMETIVLSPEDSSGFMMVRNDDEKVIETNYWGSTVELKGFYYVTSNAGAFRLLVPDSQNCEIPNILSGKHAVITYGFHRQTSKFMYEVMFDDDSDNPFALWISPGQFDRNISIADAASKDRQLIVYRNGCNEVARMPVFFRKTPILPCLDQWTFTNGHVYEPSVKTSDHDKLVDMGKQDMLNDIKYWQAMVTAKGRETVVNGLVLGNVYTWLGSDTDHKLYIKASHELELRNTLATYSDADLGEWFSLMTTVALAQTIAQAGMKWHILTKADPVLLKHCPSLQEFRNLLGQK